MLDEELRLLEDAGRDKNWKRWGPYLAERQWGTVREDYSADGDAWRYFPHDQARSRAYRWGEDGLMGLTDRECRLCFALALWNGKDPILKERLYGLTGPEGNHGEDVKECYFYLDSTPTHSYMKALYKYPHAEFPYRWLMDENARRGRADREFELEDTGVFDGGRYFDVQAEYAKSAPNDILIRITIRNRGPESATLHVLPTLWFRNTWSWGCKHEGCEAKPKLQLEPEGYVRTLHASLEPFILFADSDQKGHPPRWMFTDNEINIAKLFAEPNASNYVKDAFHEHLILRRVGVVNPEHFGTKAAAHYQLQLLPGADVTLRLRLCSEAELSGEPFASYEDTFTKRISEADLFYESKLSTKLTAHERQIARQAYAGLLWSKQFYHYIVEDWLHGDPDQPPPPASRWQGRNGDWPNLYARDIISMPDKWEYPWFAAWDLAFHTLPLSIVDPELAKHQLLLFLREWYMHPNGQIPAYEWSFSDVNPPVHAWACWRVYKMTGCRGARDLTFLARAFHKLMINFTWWVNRKDIQGNHLFAGGFLGLDNIGVFDRSKPLPGGGQLEQADGTAWMAFFCTTMLGMALELAQADPAYEDVASKFFEHFVAIADAMNTHGGTGLWDEADGFYYDQLQVNGKTFPLKIRSLVGIIPLFAAEVLEEEALRELPGFRKRLDWFLKHRQDLAQHIAYMECPTSGNRHRLLAIPSRNRLERMLKYVLDESEFLSPYGVRSLSRRHKEHPYVLWAGGEEHRVEYVPGESDTGLFGGNSNWRGPIWLPTNFLLIEALERYHHFYRDTVKVECPTGSGVWMNLGEVSKELARRIVKLFLPDAQGRRPFQGNNRCYATDPSWKNLILFHEYFHGDSGEGLGASHQTGWTALVTRLMECVSK